MVQGECGTSARTSREEDTDLTFLRVPLRESSVRLLNEIASREGSTLMKIVRRIVEQGLGDRSSTPATR